MCFLRAPGTEGAGCKTRLESKKKNKLTPQFRILIMVGFSGQNAGVNPRFSTEGYFSIVACMQLVLVSVMIPISRLKPADEDGTDSNQEAQHSPGAAAAAKKGARR